MGEDLFSSSLFDYWHKTFKDQKGMYGNTVPSPPPAGAESTTVYVKTGWILYFLQSVFLQSKFNKVLGREGEWHGPNCELLF